MLNKPVIIGALLLVLGGGMFVFKEVSITRDEELVDLGPIEAKREVSETVPLPPVVSGIVCLGGVIFIATGLRNKMS